MLGTGFMSVCRAIMYLETLLWPLESSIDLNEGLGYRLVVCCKRHQLSITDHQSPKEADTTGLRTTL